MSGPSPLPLLLSAARSPTRSVIGLVGEPGSGKTTLASQLAAAVNLALDDPTACLPLSMDGFHLPRSALDCGLPPSHPSPAECHARRGAPWTFDAPALAARLRSLLAPPPPAPLPWPSFDHAVGDPVEGGVQVPAGCRLLLLEGLYLLHEGDGWEEVGGLLRCCLYLDTEPGVARGRLLRRHQAAWGLSEEAALARIEGNDGLNAALVRACKGRADMLVSSQEAT